MNEQQTKTVTSIRDEYAAKTVKQTKLEELVSLDAKVRRPAEIFAYAFGIVAALILGVGMCLTMGVIGQSLSAAPVLGIIIGCVGILMCAVNYPIYKSILKSRKQKYGKQILQLSDDILSR